MSILKHPCSNPSPAHRAAGGGIQESLKELRAHSRIWLSAFSQIQEPRHPCDDFNQRRVENIEDDDAYPAVVDVVAVDPRRMRIGRILAWRDAVIVTKG